MHATLTNARLENSSISTSLSYRPLVYCEPAFRHSSIYELSASTASYSPHPHFLHSTSTTYIKVRDYEPWTSTRSILKYSIKFKTSESQVTCLLLILSYSSFYFDRKFYSLKEYLLPSFNKAVRSRLCNICTVLRALFMHNYV